MEERTVGVVQTAYANGSSTLFLKTALNCPVVLTKTGNKKQPRGCHST